MARREELEYLEDARIVAQTARMGALGTERAQRYADQLMKLAMDALELGDYRAAFCLVGRCLRFNIRALGVSHAYTLATQETMEALAALAVRTA